jgi:hypothetical protein
MKTEKSKVILVIQFLLILSGIMATFTFLLTTHKFITIESNRSITQFNLIISMFIMASLYLVSGIGLLKDKQFGWRFLNIYLIVSICKAIYASITFYNNYSAGSYTDSLQNLLTKQIVRIIFFAVMLFVVFNKKILTYLNIEEFRKKAEILRALLISFFIMALINVISHFAKFVL